MNDEKEKTKPDAGKDNVQGEGDYVSAREYGRDVKKFIDEHGKEIPSLAEKAEKALEGSEGADLTRAEEAGKAKARH